MNKHQLEKDLKSICGERATTSPHERWFYRSDLLKMPGWTDRLVKATPDAVVAPSTAQEVSAVLKYCTLNNIPLTPRGAGSSGLFGSVPKRGGIVLDLRGLANNMSVDAYGERADCHGAGITWWEMDKRLRREKMTLMSYPSSARSATLAGWVMTSGLGIGNIRYGPVHDQVLSARMALAAGSIREYSGKDLRPFMASEGLLGIMTDLCLKVRPLPDAASHRLLYFTRIEDLFAFLESLMQTAPLPYAIEIFDDAYLSLLKQAGYPTTSFGKVGGLALITYDGSQERVDEGVSTLHKLALAHSGEEREGGQEEWRQRFNMLRVRRAVPSLIPGSVHMPLARAAEFYSKMTGLGKRSIALLGHVVSGTDCVLMPLTTTDEHRSLEYTFALHTPAELSNLALSLGGGPGGGLGLWNAAYRNTTLYREKANELQIMKSELDPKGVLNPGMWTDPPWLLRPTIYRMAASAGHFVDSIVPGKTPETRTEAPEKEFTDCVQCGYCAGYCPTRMRWVSSTPRGRVLAARRLLLPAIEANSTLDQETVNDVFSCSLCGRCRIDCSVDIKSPEMWTDLRSRIVKAGHGLESLGSLARTIEETRNLAAKPNAQRAKWADSLKLSYPRHGAETVYFVGCVTSFYPMVQDVAKSFAQILEKAGIDFTVLGGDEWCCGYPLLSAGHADAAVRHMEHNIEAVVRLGAKRIVFTCPGCYRMWHHDYHRLTGKEAPFEMIHSAPLLAQLIDGNKITLGETKAKVTYHDPCDLGRNAGIYDEPRHVISSVPSLEFNELETIREYCNCCGSGGDLLASDQALSLDIARRKVKEILNTGASSVVTACPSCIRGITMARVAEKAPFSVQDITQLVWKAMIK